MPPARPRPSPQPAPVAPVQLSARWRVAISLLILAHLTIVVAVPLAMVPPRSLLAARIVAFARPYVDALGVSHGYAFFGPDPGPSHLVSYELEFAGGRVEKGQIPDLKEEWPRLWYHRHFMLSEKLADAAKMPPEAPERPPEPPEEDLQVRWKAAQWQQALDDWKSQVVEWKKARQEWRDIAASYAEHLRAARGAIRVRLYLKEHLIPTPENVINGQSLQDSSLYLSPLGPESKPIITVPLETPPPEEVPAPSPSGGPATESPVGPKSEVPPKIPPETPP